MKRVTSLSRQMVEVTFLVHERRCRVSFATDQLHASSTTRARSQPRCSLLSAADLPCLYWRVVESFPVPKITQNSYCTLLWRARGARAYKGGLGAEPPAWSRGRAPGQGAKPPWSWKPFKILDIQHNGKMSPFSLFSVFYKLLIISRHVDSVNIWLKWQDRFPLNWVISLADN